ncbi:MAG TPA: tripartite tricarboxylate transporter substrate binding protein [Ideonella sp.]|nr:tripartite tricarboxylate transporter substrate binding protein [Ideonella sp.]
MPPGPVRVIVPYPAGGPADVLARQLEPAMRASLGQPLLIQNLPGAGGGLGIQRLLAGPLDGSQALAGTPSDTIVAPLLNPVLGYRPEQLRLIGIASAAPVVLVGGTHLPQATLASLLAAARAPEAAGLSYGSYGVGSHAHLLAEEFAAKLKLTLLHVPYAGAAPLLQDLLAGRIDIAFLPLAGALRDAIAQGRVRLLAFASASRNLHHPEVPTVNEAAGLSGFEHDLWVGLFASAALPEEALAPWRAALHAALRDPEFRRLKLAEGSMPGNPMDASSAQRFYEAECARYRRLAGGLPRAVR